MRLEQLAGATVVTPDLDAAVAAYGDLLGYRGDAAAPITNELAASWGCPAAAGARMATLYPERGARRFVRLVEGRPAAGYRALGSYGWNAIEMIVQDLDALAARLRGSVFEIVGEPAVLDFDFTDQIRAMQVRGPGEEMLYLTEVNAEIPGFALPRADSAVGEIFVMVLGAASIAEAAATYVALGRERGPDLAARIEVLSDVHGMKAGHRHALTTIALDACSLIEIDAFPVTAVQRPPSSVGLPSGIAMVSLAIGETGFASRVVKGGVGEWIELVSALGD
jgi:catechol 2,3-dioxygenase-like lactoylglutathione lyase family enzyme